MALSHEAGSEGETGLEVTDGLYHASSAIIEPFARTGVGWAANMRWPHWPVELTPVNSRGRPQALSSTLYKKRSRSGPKDSVCGNLHQSLLNGQNVPSEVPNILSSLSVGLQPYPNFVI